MQQVQSLKEKCEDLGERMRGGNIRITGSWDQAHPAVSKLQVLQMDKDVLVERSHHSLTQRKPGHKLHVIHRQITQRGRCQGNP